MKNEILPPQQWPLSARALSLRSSAIRDLLRDAQRPGMLSLAGGLPAADLFDIEGIATATELTMREAPQAALQYGVTDGQPGLRAELVRLVRRRGLDVSADQIVVTTGSQQGIDVIARTMIDPGDRVAIESPSYLAALQVFALAQASFITLATDADGARLDALLDAPAGSPTPKLVYIVTNFGNPSGATLSLQRRVALVQWAARERVLLVEDDPYGELRVSGQAQPSLYELAADVPGARSWCAYLSTLSKIMAPGLRIGFAVLPPWLHDAVVKVKQSLDLHTSSFAQEIAQRYLATDRLVERLPRMCGVYRERRDALIEALTTEFGSTLTFNQPDGGMFLWARFTDGTDASRMLNHARDRGMIFVPGEAFFHDAPDRAALRLSFATLSPPQLHEAARRMAQGRADATASSV